MNKKHLINSFTDSIVATLVLTALLCMSYFMVEPSVGRAQDTSGPFTISQVISKETSFMVDAASTTLSGTLSGITGGTANGSTTVVVQTNSPSGYTMQIAFANNSTEQAMKGRVSSSGSIRDYQASSTEPTYNFSTASTSAVFAYSVSPSATSSSDLDNSFLNDGSTACNSGVTYTADKCWMEPSTSNFQIIDRDTDTPGVATTILFRVYVPNNATPALVADTYTATATLTVASK